MKDENVINCLRRFAIPLFSQMKNLVRAYFMESIWFHQKHLPTTEEYMSIALTTSAYALLAVTSLVGMGNIVTKDSFDWLFNEPKMITASQIICRLMDDIVSYEVTIVIRILN